MLKEQETIRAEAFVRKILVDIFHQETTQEQISEVTKKVIKAVKITA